MVVRVALMVMRGAVLLALILGILLWTRVISNRGIEDTHQLLGIIVVLSLWVLGGVMASTKGGLGLGIGAFVYGLIVAIVGLTQKTILIGDLHWIIQIIHLLLGLAAAGFGESIARRYKRLSAAS